MKVQFGTLGCLHSFPGFVTDFLRLSLGFISTLTNWVVVI